MTPFTIEIIKIIRSIPAGKVASYGQVALYAGNHRGARQVSRTLHTCSKKYNLPWHRVINSQGKISLTGEKFELQYGLLKEEGIEFGLNNTINFKKYGF
ncbi:MAG: MGMT family protein [Proteobacteria bacterium]|nr:MGMT family protein [Pseudomonadota bacterium]